MSFEPQNQLEKVLVKAVADPAFRPQFYRELAGSDLFIIIEQSLEIENGKTTLEEDQTIQIRPITWEGQSYLPVFTSLPRLQAALLEDADYLAFNAIEFMKLTQGSEFILNPGSDYGKIFLAHEIEEIVNGTFGQPDNTYVVQNPTPVQIGQPANYPTELVETLRRYFKTNSVVKKAYLAHFFNPEQDEKGHTLIAIEHTGAMEPIFTELAIIVRDVAIPDPPVDFVSMTGNSGIENYFLRECKPFYTRRLWGIF